MFTEEQKKSAVRWVLTLIGGVVAGWVAKSGFISADQVMSFFTSETIIGFLTSAMTAGLAFAWSMIAKTDKGVVASAAALPGTTVVTTPEIAAAVPSNDALSSAAVKVVSK